jgi:hypothetical protein
VKILQERIFVNSDSDEKPVHCTPENAASARRGQKMTISLAEFTKDFAPNERARVASSAGFPARQTR